MKIKHKVTALVTKTLYSLWI